MSNYPKISLMVPCYNIAQVCDRFFDSLLCQTYNNMEIVLVNDGSTDNTEKVLLQKQSELEKRGFEVKYIYQENKGLGGAINTALKNVTGDYLCWADPDDYFIATSFEDRCLFLENNTQYACVTSDAYLGNGEINDSVDLMSRHFANNDDENQFLAMLDANSIFCAGCHMIRMSSQKKVNPNMDIYECRGGQNWQLLLPIYYSYKRAFLNKPLYYYVSTEGSMQNSLIGLEKRIGNIINEENISIETLKRICMTDKERNQLIKRVFRRCLMKKLVLCLTFEDYKKFDELYKNRTVNLKMDIQMLIVLLRRIPFVNNIYKKLRG